MRKLTLLASLLSTVALTALPAIASAQAFPNKPIRIVVPFPPGGTTDIVTRLVSEPLGRELGTTVVIENRGGGGGSIGAAEVARAAPDGYTLGVATVSTMAVNPACNPKLPYDPLKSFVPISNIAITANVVAVHPKVPANDMNQFVDMLKKNPGKLSFATSGTCGIAHLLGETFKSITGTFFLHIPYRGSGPALNDVLAGQVEILFDNLPSSMPHIQSGKLRAIAVAWPERVQGLPNVPTYKELGMPLMNDPAWYGLIAPAGTPPAVVNRIREALVKATASPELRARFAQQGAAVVADTPEQFAETIRRELEKARDVVRKQGIKFEG